MQSYMEDHLQNKDRLDKEWEALCSYQAEPAACTVGQQEQNVQCNRPHGVLVCECFTNSTVSASEFRFVFVHGVKPAVQPFTG